MKQSLFIPVSPESGPVVRRRCAFESSGSAYDYACFKGYSMCTTEEMQTGDHDSCLVMDRRGTPVRAIYNGDSFRILGSFDDWYVCESGKLLFQQQNGEFFEIPKEMLGKPEVIAMMLDKGDSFQFRNFMYAYLRVLHDKGIRELSVRTEAFPFDNE